MVVVEEVFKEEGEEVPIVGDVVVDTRRLPVKLFSVRRISSLLELAWSNAMVAPDCFESRKKSIPRKVRTNEAVMFGVSIIDVEVYNKCYNVTNYVRLFDVWFRTKLWRDEGLIILSSSLNFVKETEIMARQESVC